jgi:hypothetical protein
MSTRVKLIIAALLLVLPIAGRWVWFNRGLYAPPTIPELDDSQIEVALPQYSPLADEVSERSGTVVFDLGHDNNLEVDDLTPLQERLKTRGVDSRTVDGMTAFLDTELQGALALVVAAPTFRYTEGEVQAVLDFVEDGGRVLLVADPTRQIPVPEEDILDLADILLPESAVPAINSLANPLGVAYFDDYLYNLVENEANYRNVRLSVGDAEHPLSEGLETVTLFAAHSVQSDGPAILVGDENTHSELRTGETELAGAVTAVGGNVLALGDLTMLTAPYHTVSDNDRFLSNVADWLVSAERVWHLRDFPFLFQRPVDLVQISGEFVDPRLVAVSSTLDDVLSLADLSLSMREKADPDRDALFVGTFDDVELVQDYLEDAGVVITIVEEEEAGTPTPTPAAEEEEERNTIAVEGFGTVIMEGTSLFLVDQSEGRVVVIALAEDGDSVIQALDRLSFVDFFGCVDSDRVTLCSTGEAGEGIGLDEEPRGPEEQEGEPTPPAELEESQPRIGSVLESEIALAAGVPWLQELAEEEYEETSQPGETYTYTISMEEPEDLIWAYGWCTTSKELLQQNWEHITVDSTVNGQELALSRFAVLEAGTEGEECRLYYALVTDWPEGTHTLINEVTFDEEIFDGTDTFPAGTHYYEYVVTVAP